MQGTLHIEGHLKIKNDDNEAIISSDDSLPAARRKIADLVQIRGISDSTTEQKSEKLRWLETAARHIHFRVIGTQGKTVDQATEALLKKIVAPFVFGEVIYVPTMKALLFSEKIFDRR
jgi:hypothetical protein